MSASTRATACSILAAATTFAQPLLASPDAATTSSSGAAAHDGARDFDPLIGTWKATLKRLERPLSGSTKWIAFEGTQVTKSIWDGRATLDEFRVDSPATGTHIDGLTVRIFNRETQQWHIYWANARKGAFDQEPVVGGFKNGRGEFYGQDYHEGRAIFVRYVWSDITPTSGHFEQSYSADGGKTWEANWISDISREKPIQPLAPATSGSPAPREP